ncbi:hypothetical protein SLEP1_g53370 [Rubroshorea leprosula]|uniref:Disease resistance RPP13-like protein 1 n=1 Tax=Rubroshorea leprosula TaxID=152421 RepID=A0AAV5M9E9_9ROSI|nr:hypothetical protein SLEP1_g53370 [Rubroshorea leprosula]
MEVLSFVGGSLLSATFDLLLEKLNGYLCDQLRDSKEEVHAHMKNWKTLLSKITTILQHAEENQVANLFVKSCLDDLKDLAYDMEDILEEFVIDARRSELNAESDARGNKRQKTTFNFMNLRRSEAKPNQEIDSVVNDLNVRLQHIEKEMHTFGLINLIMKDKDRSHKVTARRLPESSVLEDKVWGRDRDKDAILERVLEDGGSFEQDFVIPIVGMGGLGKTTLARLIYNDKKLKGKFDLKAWVCVSDEFDVARITRTILEHVTGKEPRNSDFSLLQEELKGKLSGHKFFLVLDDVWNKEYGQWDVLKRPFMSGAPGSKIIVTTRNKNVGTMMRGDDGVYNLALLQDDACLPLFTRHALGKENFDVHPNLQDIGEKLVKRCKRLPLALKTLGGVLRGKLRRDEWENVLDSDIWSSSEDRSRILPALRLSYNHLPSHLKRCFAYCALFPKDYEFDKKKLVMLWMAEGLLQQQSHEKKQMEEEIGHQYFQELLSRSLFQQSSTNKSRMGDEKLEKARHLSFTPHKYEISKRFAILDKLKHLRTFLPTHGSTLNLSQRILHDFIPTLNRLRVLSLCDYQIRKLPDSFENLKHMRYIDLSRTTIERIPESVGSLLLLQTLLLCGCHELSELPMTIGNLIDLHHLDITNTSSLKNMPSGIGNLKNLVTLSKFIVGKASGMMTRLFDLKNLSQIRGRLSILDLQNVLDVQDAREANLDKIHGLEELVLEWINSDSDMEWTTSDSDMERTTSDNDLERTTSDNDLERTTSDNDLDSNSDLERTTFDNDMEQNLERTTFDHDLEWTTSDNDQDELVLKMEVLNWLKPYSNLKSLEISCYGGENFPLWVCDPSLFFNLSSMELRRCKRCTLLPSLGLLPILKKLIIEGMDSIEAIGFEFYGQHGSFPSLAELVFRNMPKWKEWTSPTGSASEFPCLHRLLIENCPKLLGQLPSNLSSLKELDVRGCNGKLLKSMGDVPSLTYLRIERISELTCLPMSMSLPSLKELSIRYCNGVFFKSMVDLTSLTNLRIERISELTCLPKSFTQSWAALETLDIADCNDLTCLWEEGTEIEQSHLPFNLKHLRLKGCGALKSLPDAMMMRMDGSNSSNPSVLMLRLESNLHLVIKNVPCLYSSQDSCYQLAVFLKEFTVTDGGEWLESFPERMLQNCTGLQSIGIDYCKILKSLPNLDYVSNLTKLSICHCKVLESIPEELWSCTPNLKQLMIKGCENFKSLPNTMYQLKSLQNLWMQSCPSIEFISDGGLPPNLTDLRFRYCKNLKCVPNTMYQLTLLQNLSLSGEVLTMGLQNLTSLRSLAIEQKIPLNIVLPSSLTYLQIEKEENLESIPGGLFQNLSSLHQLFIQSCPKLRSLPKEAFPPSLGQLCIRGCPHLKRQRFEMKGDYWTLTWSIPSVWESRSSRHSFTVTIFTRKAYYSSCAQWQLMHSKNIARLWLGGWWEAKFFSNIMREDIRIYCDGQVQWFLGEENITERDFSKWL